MTHDMSDIREDRSMIAALTGLITKEVLSSYRVFRKQGMHLLTASDLVRRYEGAHSQKSMMEYT